VTKLDSGTTTQHPDVLIVSHNTSRKIMWYWVKICLNHYHFRPCHGI